MTTPPPRAHRSAIRSWVATTSCSFSFVALLGATAVQAQAPMFLTETPYDPPEHTNIYQIDPATGAMTLRGELGASFSPVLALAAADGRTLYAAGTDNAGTICPGSTFSCLLLKIVIDPASTVPISVEVVGPFRTGNHAVAEITGMTFRSDGVLYMQSQSTSALYTVDVTTAEAVLVGTLPFPLYGGDLTFDAEGRLLLWTNDLGSLAGLYQVDPATAAATLIDPEPGRRLTGLAALGHSNVLYGSSVFDDRLYTVDPVVGFTGVSTLLTLDGVRFDVKRGDLDSPYCVDDAGCDDGNSCTRDRCTSGGCRNLFEDATCDGSDDDCDGDVDEDFVTAETSCGIGACAATGVTACLDGLVVDSCDAGVPAADDAACNGIDDDCDGAIDEEFVSSATTCGIGACARIGETVCLEGSLVEMCESGSPAADDATCNGIDDDCDGAIDEDADRDADGVSDCSDNCPDDANPAQTDDDGDGIGNACDCAPADPANDPPTEVGNTLILSKSGSVSLSWNDDGLDGTFRVYRGSQSPGASWVYNQECLGAPVFETSASDDTIPSPGTVHFYYVARVGCSESILGRDSDGVPVRSSGGCASAP